MDLKSYLQDVSNRVMFGKRQIDETEVLVYIWFEGESLRYVVNTTRGVTVENVPVVVIQGWIDEVSVEYVTTGTVNTLRVTDEYARSLLTDPNYFMKDSCDECDGFGEVEERMTVECPECYGECIDEEGDECLNCVGCGEVEEMDDVMCIECEGTGRVFRSDVMYSDIVE